MSLIEPPVLTPPPSPAPQRGDRATFTGRVDAFVTWLSTGVAQLGQMALSVYNNAQAAYEIVASAAGDASSAAGSAASALDSKNAANQSKLAAATSEANAFSYLRAYRATSYGALASDPTLDPNGDPPTIGDEYFNTTSKLLRRFNGSTWQASDLATANLAAVHGAAEVGFLQNDADTQAMTVEAGLRDARMRVENVRTVAKTVEKMRSGAAVTIVAYGDSETYGYQPGTGIQVATPYPSALQTKLRALYNNANITVVNSGTSGWQSDEGVANIQTKVLNFTPDLAIVMFGINDVRGSGAGGAALTIDQYRVNMSKIVKTLRDAGIEAVVMSSNPINDTTNGYHRKLLSFVRVAEEVANSYGAGFVNLNQEVTRLFANGVESPQLLFPDKVHFADAKYSLIADILIGRVLNSVDPSRVVRITESTETDVPVMYSPFIDTDVSANYVNSGQFYQINAVLRSDSSGGTYLRFPFFVEVPGMDLVLKAPKNVSGGRAVFKDNGVAIKTVDFYANESHVFEAEDTIIENIAPGHHVIEVLVSDMTIGRSTAGTYGNAYFERFRFRKSRTAKAKRPYKLTAGGTIGTAEAFKAISQGALRWTSSVANDCGVLLTDSDCVELKSGKTLVIEAEGRLFSGSGVSWFGNPARGETDTPNPSGCNTGYLLYFEGTGATAVRLYGFGVNNGYAAIQNVTQAMDYSVSHKIRITHTSAGVITVFLDGVQIIQATNTDRSSGWFGLYSHFAGTLELTRFEYAYI